MSLVENERTKLTATALNGAAISCFTVGVAAPVAATIYAAAPIGGKWLFLAIAAVAWIGLAVSLHFTARHVLGGLSE